MILKLFITAGPDVIKHLSTSFILILQKHPFRTLKILNTVLLLVVFQIWVQISYTKSFIAIKLVIVQYEGLGVMMFNATFNNISLISWQ